jgi:hypothetical protein
MMDSDPSIPNPSTAPSLAEQIPTGLTQDGVPQLAPITATVKRDQAPWYEGLLGAADVGKTLLGGAVGMVPAALETGARVLGGSPMKAEDIYAQALGHYTPDLLTQRGKEMGEDLSGFMERNKIPLAIPELAPFEEGIGAGMKQAMLKSDEALKSLTPAHGELGSNLGNVFHSALDNAAQGIKRGAGTGAEFLQELMGKGGIKKAEIEDRGLDALANSGKMTKQQFEQELNARSAPQLQQTVLGHNAANRNDLFDLSEQIYLENQANGVKMSLNEAQREAQRILDEQVGYGEPKFEKYTLPKGSNYQEMLLHLPENESGQNFVNEKHFEVPNIVAHMRLKDREGLNGEKLLNLEELQSDWHQEGRDRGYLNPENVNNLAELQKKHSELSNQKRLLGTQRIKLLNQIPEPPNEVFKQLMDQENNIQKQMSQLAEQIDNVPNDAKYGVLNAPFKKNWDEMALKRLIHHAAANDYDGIAITPGEVQAKRYGQTEGKGMKGFYDVKVPTLLNNIGKKYGVKTGEINSDVGEYKVMKDSGSLPFRLESKHSPDLISRHATADDAWNEAEKLGTQKFHYFPITPEMKKDVLSNGLPMYRDGGLVQI